MRLAPSLLLAALAAAPLAAQQAEAPFVVRESGRGFSTLQKAVDSIGNGRGTIVIAPGRYRQCAVQDRGEIAYVAARPGAAALDGLACEGKGALVLRGRGATVEGLTFANIRVADRNGAGIRLEHGNLIVRESLFRDSESGILSGNDSRGTIVIEQSTFSGLGGCPDDCSHSVYIGAYGSLTVRRSRFQRGTGGHYVKSRSPHVVVEDSSFDDTSGHATNYMIDLPGGATGRIAGNRFIQGRDKENYSAFIVVAAEGVVNDSAGLTVTGNDARIVPGIARPSAFVADFTGAPMRIEGNRLGAGLVRYQRR